jgi:hypothetical protein
MVSMESGGKMMLGKDDAALLGKLSLGICGH